MGIWLLVCTSSLIDTKCYANIQRINPSDLWGHLTFPVASEWHLGIWKNSYKLLQPIMPPSGWPVNDSDTLTFQIASSSALLKLLVMTKGPENNDTHLHYLSLEYTANSNIIVKQYIVKWTKIKAASGVSLLPHCIRVIGVI